MGIKSRDEKERDYWRKKLEFWKFVYTKANSVMGTDRQPPDGLLNPQLPPIPSVECIKRYLPEGVSGDIYLAVWKKQWEKVSLFDTSSLDNAMMKTKYRGTVGKLIQNGDQAGAVDVIESEDKKVVALIENYEQCGKAEDPSMVFHKRQHEFWKYIITEINNEFAIVAKNYISGVSTEYRAGTITYGTHWRKELSKDWQTATDMLASPVSVFDALRFITRDSAVNLSKYANMIAGGNESEFFAWCDESKAKDEAALERSSDDVEKAYWENKLALWDFVVADTKLRMGIE